MKWLDGVIRDVRIAKAIPYIRDGDRLLDIGCFDLTLLRRVAPRIQSGVGVDPLAEPAISGNIRILRGTIPGSIHLDGASFDCITMLAVLEHIPDTGAAAKECARLLAPGGRVIITVPRPQVDHILGLLSKLRLIDGMSLDEHHGYDVSRTAPIFERAGMALLRRTSFELGLNCLFVFEKPHPARGRSRNQDALPLRVALQPGMQVAVARGTG